MRKTTRISNGIQKSKYPIQKVSLLPNSLGGEGMARQETIHGTVSIDHCFPIQGISRNSGSGLRAHHVFHNWNLVQHRCDNDNNSKCLGQELRKTGHSEEWKFRQTNGGLLGSPCPFRERLDKGNINNFDHCCFCIGIVPKSTIISNVDVEDEMMVLRNCSRHESSRFCDL